MIPIPPIHWIKLRQKRILREWLSMSSRILAPVVVKPDMVSKKALRGDIPSTMNGMAPKIIAVNQLRATIAKASLSFQSSSDL
ncbi:MAG: hypothetical protein A4E24_00321 [Methanomethylovorans sp. PtaU1.Bin093]|nr:MAG: hypothetical protein A4E24_00321 [Methanomethylovorans sp. PtaU1.Bin093]